MSGIYGLYHKDGRPVEDDWLNHMRDAMPEWGNDSCNSWQKRNFGIGILLSYNTPESIYENQPLMLSIQNSCVLAADVRLDNRDELCTALDIGGAEKPTTPDSYLVAAAFTKWGNSLPEHLIGAFAVAVWDSTTNSLFLCRDHLGFRPLFIYESSRMVAFASDIRAILAVPGVPAEIDEDAVIANRTQRASYVFERSLIKNIRKLKPGCSLTIAGNGSVKKQFWHPENAPLVRFSTDEAYKERLLELLKQSILSCIRSYDSVGSHLSGGIDSTAITVLASRLLRQSGTSLAGAYTWSPPPSTAPLVDKDERIRMQTLCAAEDIRCIYNNTTADAIVDDWLSDVSTLPQANMVEETPTRKLAAKDGVKVLLSGWGGDQFVSYGDDGFYSQLLIYGQWKRLAHEIRQAKQARNHGIAGLLKNRCIYPLLPRILHCYRRNLLPRQLQDNLQVSDKSMRSIIELAIEHLERPTVKANMQLPLQLGTLTYRIDGWCAQGVLDDIEYRYPLLDVRIIEYCLGLPADQLVRSGWNRYLFRSTLDGILPKDICWNSDLKKEPAKALFKDALMNEARQKYKQVVASRHAGTMTPSSTPFDQY